MSSGRSAYTESSSRPGPASIGGRSRMPSVNGVGKPCAGEPHARIDGRELETELKLTTATEKNHLGRNPGATTAPAPTVGRSHRASSRPSNLAFVAGHDDEGLRR